MSVKKVVRKIEAQESRVDRFLLWLADRSDTAKLLTGVALGLVLAAVVLWVL